MRPLVAWVSPFDEFRGVAQVVSAAEAVRAACPGRALRMALLTAYGP